MAVPAESLPRKAALLVKYLALSPGCRMHRDVILERLWPGFALDSADNNLRQTLHAARRGLASVLPSLAILRTSSQIVSLAPVGSIRVDVADFEGGADSARAERSVRAYEDAIGLYKGDLLPDDLYDDFLSDRRNELRHLYTSLLLEFASIEESAGRFSASLGLLERALKSEPQSGRVLAARREALLRAGRLSEAALAQRRLDARPNTGSGDGDALSRQPEAKTNIVPLRTRFIGRKRELSDISERLGEARLLTLVGPGGIGKSRLAHELAGSMVPRFFDGAWLVELADCEDASSVARRIATALGVRDCARETMPAVREWVGDRELLLVLDNCEHLLATCAEAANALLDVAPSIRILATSRERLGVNAESVFPLGQLTVDMSGSMEEISQSDAVRLFVDRAQQLLPSFALTGDNAAVLATICQRLDGLPLGIELAAAWVDMLPTERIAERLDLLDMPAGPSAFLPKRHRSLRSTFDWSYELLSTAERMLLARLSVFRGGWDFEAAEAIASDALLPASSLPQLLYALVAKSLVRQDPSSQRRFSSLETLRRFARERLEHGGDERIFQRVHAEHYARLAERADRGLATAEQDRWISMLSTERENMDAAISWSLENREWDLALTLGRRLWMFWSACGHLWEGRRWLKRILDQAPDVASEARADVLNGAGVLARQQDDYSDSRQMHERGLAMQRIVNDDRGASYSLNNLGLLFTDLGEYANARGACTSSLAILKRRNDQWAQAAVYTNLGRLAALQGDPIRARRDFRLARRLQIELGDERGGAYSLQNLATIDLDRSDLDGAEAKLGAAVETLERLGDSQGTAYCARYLGVIAMRRGDRASAAALFHRAMDVFRLIGDRQGLAAAFEDVAPLAAAMSDERTACRLVAGAEALRKRIGSPAPSEVARRIGGLRRRISRRLGARTCRDWWDEGAAAPESVLVREALAFVQKTSRRNVITR